FPAAGSPVDMKMYALFFFGRFCFIFLLAIIFDSRDIVLDKMNGLGSLATDVSKGGMQIISAVALIFYITTGIIVNRYQGSVAQLIAWLTTSAVIIVIYLFAQKRRGYLFYYFLVDGLMLFSALTTYVATIN
ncbi:MAG: hypothetical protein ABIO05_01770, partial [Ferruginibacter sp.]